jgi:predicted nucleic acid-binding protein
MTYLVDANILSEATKQRPDGRVVAWLRANERDFVVDSAVLGELALGILVLPRGRKRARLERWFDTVVAHIECLAWDASVSKRWAQLVVEMRKKGEILPLLDSLIAATALMHGFTVATRNVRDFRRVGVPVVDPFR